MYDLDLRNDLDSVKVNQRVIYLGQRSFCSKAIVGTHTRTHQTDW